MKRKERRREERSKRQQIKTHQNIEQERGNRQSVSVRPQAEYAMCAVDVQLVLVFFLHLSNFIFMGFLSPSS